MGAHHLSGGEALVAVIAHGASDPALMMPG
jgi:hypothetical protein